MAAVDGRDTQRDGFGLQGMVNGAEQDGVVAGDMDDGAATGEIGDNFVFLGKDWRGQQRGQQKPEPGGGKRFHKGRVAQRGDGRRGWPGMAGRIGSRSVPDSIK